MRGDFSRLTFDPRKRYAGVLWQQGRAQLDADWNEHEAILRRRLQIETRDVIGEHGGPRHHAGFGIELDDDGTPWIGAGRYYVEGRLCENEERCRIDEQPFGDGSTYQSAEGDVGELFYLDVWERFVDAVADPHLADVALGGADTAARVQTVWTVRRLPITKRSVVAEPERFADRERELRLILEHLERLTFEQRTITRFLDDLRQMVRTVIQKLAGNSTLRERMLEERIDDLASAVGTLRERPALLEELERMIAELIDAARVSGSDAAALRQTFVDLDRAVDEELRKAILYQQARRLFHEAPRLSLRSFHAHEERLRSELEELRLTTEFRRTGLELVDALRSYVGDLERAHIHGDLAERLHTGELEEFEVLQPRKRGTMAARTASRHAGYLGSENLLYRVEIHTADEGARPTMKWSRENASFSARVLQVDGAQLVIHPPPGGIDRFPKGGIVEVTTRRRELAGRSGALATIADVDEAGATLALTIEPDLQLVEDDAVFVRLWDAAPGTRYPIEIEEGAWIPLEDGIEVVFSDGPFRAGDFWLIPARAANAWIEWPIDSAGYPEHCEPLGIVHAYAPLAVVRRAPRLDIHDRRHFFEPLTRHLRRERGEDVEHRRAPVSEEREVAALHVVGMNWENDSDLSLDLANEGFVLTLDRPADPRAAAARPIAVTAEPVYERSRRPAQTDPTPVMLNGEIAISGPNIEWKPASTVVNRLAQLKGQWGAPKLLLRIAVKGNAVWADAGGEIVHLAGRALHVPSRNGSDTEHLRLQLPTMRDERVSDFESWVYV
jgi:hypothetical protein